MTDSEWRLIREESRNGPMQMAIEEVAARSAVEDDIRTVRVFTWEPSTLSLGYGQDPETVDWEYCTREGIDVTRRQTGGGGIYHDQYADISYSIIAPADELPGDLMECYRQLCEPILRALDRMGVDASFADQEYPALYQPACYLRSINPAHDVMASGKKLSGNAQYRQRDAVIQHGSLSYDVRPEPHRGVFANPDTSSADFQKRVTGIRQESGIERNEAIRVLEDTLGKWCSAAEGEWTNDELDAARTIAERKYANDSWIRDRKAPLDTRQ